MGGVRKNVAVLVLWAALASVSPSGIRAATTEIGPAFSTERITRLLNGALPGDTLLFLPGIYRGGYRLEGVRGEPDRPVVIRGAVPPGFLPGSEGKQVAVIDGATSPGMGKDHSAFRLEECTWITMEQFVIRNCWTDLVSADHSNYISLRNCDLKGGKRALFARGRKSHHFLIEGCRWEQDERVWTGKEGYTWEEVHHGIHEHYNGSLFQGSGISGVFVLRDNEIANVFNAFRLSRIDGGDCDPLACTNGEICRNTITNSADNVLEPEVHAGNLHFYHNRIVHTHALVSITEVGGGDIYIYGNTAFSPTREMDGWTVFKISSRTRALERPMWIFHNSWYVDFDIIGSPRNLWQNDHLRHYNNACYSAGSDTFGIYNLGKDNRFDYDCSNVPFPELLTGRGLETHGIVADPKFRDPARGDFRLKEGSQCINRGAELEGLVMEYRGSAPDIGAYDNGRLVEGPPFRYLPPEATVPYREMPRVTRVRNGDGHIEVWFSLPLDESTLAHSGYRLENSGSEVILEMAVLTGGGHCLVLEPELPYGNGSGDLPPGDLPPGDLFGMIRHDLPPGDLPTLFLPARPAGRNGMRMTAWASAVPVRFHIPSIPEMP